MKKLIAILLSALVCLFAFASCGDKKEAPKDTTASETEKEATIPSATKANEPESSESTPVASESETAPEAETSIDATEATEATDATETTDATEEVTEKADEPTSPASADKAEIANALEKELSAIKSGAFADGSYAANAPFAQEDAATYAALFANFSYTVGEVTVIDANNATVKATITMVDLGAALMAYMQEISAHSDEENWDEDFAVFYQILSNENATLATNEVTVNMVKTENGWTVSADNDELKNAISGSINSSGFLS